MRKNSQIIHNTAPSSQENNKNTKKVFKKLPTGN